MVLRCCFPCFRLGKEDDNREGRTSRNQDVFSNNGIVSPMHVNRGAMLEIPERLNIRVSNTKKASTTLSALFVEDNLNILSDLGNGLPSPHGQDQDEYCYYCPICFLNYRGIYRSSCCNNYFCYSCLHEYVAGKYGIPPQELQLLQYPFWVEIPCPHCGTENFEPEHVQRNESIRSYGEKENDFDLKSDERSFTSSKTSSPSVYDSCSTITSIYGTENAELSSFNTNSTKIIENIRSQEIQPDNKSQSNLLSPVRIGDTFDKLVKKMQKYEDSPSYEQNSSAISSSSNSKPVEINTDCHDETRQSKEEENMQTNG